MNKKTLALIAGGLLVIGGLVSLFVLPKKADALASEISRVRSATASTTVVYMTPGTATTTLSFATADVDSYDLLIQVNASSTASELNWKYQFSNDNLDWFDAGEQINYALTTATGVTGSATSTLAAKVYSASTLNRWNPNASGISRIAVNGPKLSANYQRVQFFVPAGVGNLSLYAEATLKRNAN